MTQNTTKNTAGATTKRKTRGATKDATARGAGDKTPRAYKPRARRCKGCGVMFTPLRKTARFHDDNCRKKYHRQHTAKKRPASTTHQELELITCAYCGLEKLLPAGKGARYCSPAHRNRAYKIRRAAAVETVARVFNQPVEKVLDRVDVHGIKKAVETLASAGYAYDESIRQWVKQT